MRILILTAVLIASTNLFGQFSRTFFNTDYGKSFRETFSIKDGNDNLLFQVYEDTLNHEVKLRKGIINNEGDLIAVDNTVLVSNAYSFFPKITGISKNNDGSFNVSLLCKNNNLISYQIFKLLNGGVISTFTYPSLLNNGYVKTLNIGNELITYAVSGVDGLIRIANSSSDYQMFTTEIVDSINFEQIPNDYKLIDFVELQGVEYLTVKGVQLYKRINSNNYFTSNNAPSHIGYGFDLLTFNDELFLVTDTTISKLDGNFQFIQSYELNIRQNQPFIDHFDFIEAISDNSNVYIFFGGTIFRYFTSLNNNFNINYSQLQPFSVNSIQASNGELLIAGKVSNVLQDINPILFSSGASFLILKNNLSLIEPFIEYSQSFNHNKINTNIYSGNMLFKKDHLTGNNAFSYKLDSIDVASIYGSVNYLIGKNNSNEIIGNYFGNYSSGVDFLVGPVSSTYGDFDIFQSKYNRGYFVTKQMIQQHLANLQNGTPNYIAPFGIREWPAHGDVTLGQALNLAEFIDVNNNGVYEPYNGDYPSIYGDECLLTLQHKVDSVNGTKLEWYNYFHVYNCDSSEAESNTVFLRSIYVNYGDSIHDVYMTNYTDFDLGYNLDDYIGTNVKEGLIYVYNADDDDENGNGRYGFGFDIPSMGMQFLEGVKFANDSLDNSFGIDSNQCVNGFGFGDGILDNEYTTLESSMLVVFTPINDLEYYNLSQGKWGNGTSMTYGGEGLSSTGVIAKYFCPGTSDSLGYGTHGQIINDNWSEISAAIPNNDRRAIGSTGKFNLGHNKSISFLQAFTIAFDTVNHTPEFSSKKLFEYAAILRDEYGNDSSACGGNFQKIRADLSVTEKTMLDFNVYPNPFNSSLIVDGLKSNSGQINVIGLDGKVFLTKNISNSKEEIQLDYLNEGLYLIQIINSGQTVVKKVIKR